MSRFKVLTSAAIAAAVGFGSVAVSADEVADFYKGKRLKMIVGSGAGGGYIPPNNPVFKSVTDQRVAMINASIAKLRKRKNNPYALEAIRDLEKTKFKLLHDAEKEKQKREDEMAKLPMKVVEVRRGDKVVKIRRNPVTGKDEIISESKYISPEQEAFLKRMGKNEADRKIKLINTTHKAYRGLQSDYLKNQKLQNTINRAKALISPWTTGWGAVVFKHLPYTQARELSKLFREIKANELMQAVQGVLDQYASGEFNIKALNDIATMANKIFILSKTEYKNTFGKYAAPLDPNIFGDDLELINWNKNPFDEVGDNNTGGDPENGKWIKLPSGIEMFEPTK